MGCNSRRPGIPRAYLISIDHRDQSRTDALSIWGGAQLDSLLGATLQRTQYSNTSKRILTDTSTVSQDSDIKVVSGIDVLSNNQVWTSSSTRSLAVLSPIAPHLPGQPYLFGIDCIGARISCLVKNKMEVPFGIRFFFVFSVYL